MTLISAATAITLILADTLKERVIAEHWVYTDYTSLGLRHVPADIYKTTQALFLGNNSIDSFADQFCTSDCGTRNRTSLCSSLQFIKILDLSRNLIETIPSECFSEMTLLSILDFSNNNLNVIPEDIFLNNKYISSVSFSNNRISHFEVETFQNLSYLYTLFIDRNNIHDLHKDLFKGLNSLHRLVLSQNKLMKIHYSLFSDLRNLRYLSINNNFLTCLSEFTFSHLKNLSVLDVSYNNISYLSSTFFSNMKNLKQVNFRHNAITSLSRMVFLELMSIAYVDFSFNRLRSVYISRIPVSLSSKNNSYVLVDDTGLCEGLYMGLPCFLPNNLEKKGYRFHSLDFSINNICEVFFSQREVSHTLEILRISFAGNLGLVLPVSFIKQEIYITQLIIDETNLNWRNITLFDKILDLPHLKNLSIIGSEACGFYMQQIIFSVFNSNLRIKIECSKFSGVLPYLINETAEHSNTLYMENKTYDFTTYDASPGEMCMNITDITPNESPCQSFENLITLRNSQYEVKCMSLIDCSYTTLAFLPTINSSAYCVLLSHNAIRDADQHYFSNFTNLFYLDLSFNKLYSLPDGIFSSLDNLEVLKLNENYLTHLNSLAFKGLINIQYLHLHRNLISSYDFDLFSYMKRLKMISIDFFNLSWFHEKTFKDLTSLTKLYMQETSLPNCHNSALNETHFISLRSLFVLKITRFCISSSYVVNLFSSPALTFLDLSDCLLPVPFLRDFKIAPTVKVLYLEGNNIVFLDEGAFSKLTELRELDLSRNEIEFVPNNVFVNLHLLKFLNLSNNKISYIPSKALEPLTELSHLDLSYNQILITEWISLSKLFYIQFIYLIEHPVGHQNNTNSGYSQNDIPGDEISSNKEITTANNSTLMNSNNILLITLDSFHATGRRNQNYCNLDRLVLIGNYIPHIRSHFFADCSSTLYIIISFNSIQSIDSDVFKNTPNLKALHMPHNSLKSIDKYIFRNLSYLTKLDLQNNKLEFIEAGAFVDLHSLVSLNLSFNLLETFEFQHFSSQSNLKQLILNDNRLTSLNSTMFFEALGSLLLSNNPLSFIADNVFYHMPSIFSIVISNTSLCDYKFNTFQNLTSLNILVLGGGCLRGLSYMHFAKLHSLVVLDISLRYNAVSPDSQLSWKNLTLMNYWFEMRSLDYLVLTGHPICEEVNWVQIVENIFLSETWKYIVCSVKSTVPNFIISHDGKTSLEILPV